MTSLHEILGMRLEGSNLKSTRKITFIVTGIISRKPGQAKISAFLSSLTGIEAIIGRQFNELSSVSGLSLDAIDCINDFLEDMIHSDIMKKKACARILFRVLRVYQKLGFLHA